MRQFHNELITSTYDGGLLGAIHADSNYLIISDTMLPSLELPQLSPMTDHQKLCVLVPFVTLQSISKNS